MVAEVFLIAWRRIGDIPSDNEVAWLLAVARRVLSNAHRGDARRERLLVRLHEAVPVPSTDNRGSVDDNDAFDRVRDALARLRPADTEILQLTTWEELSHAEIAVVLDCSINAVAIRLHRARQRLADELATEWAATKHAEPGFEHAESTTPPAPLRDPER